MESFKDCIRESNLLEVAVLGERFTWEKNRVKERLDWVFCNHRWEERHIHVKAFHQLKYKSDHRVVVVFFFLLIEAIALNISSTKLRGCLKTNYTNYSQRLGKTKTGRKVSRCLLIK